MRAICNAIIIGLLLFLCAAANAKEGVLFADKVDYNPDEEYAEATGHVRVIFGKYVIHADRVLYDLKKDEIWSYGNIAAFSRGSEVALGDAALFKGHAKQMIISSFVLHFKKSDSVIAAKLANRISDSHSKLNKATYTSCPTCNNKKPMWQISASKAEILQDKYKVVYRNVFFQVYGVPVAYFPYFSHPLPGAPSKSGVLVPELKKNRLGIPIYFRPRSNFDMTITPMLSKKNSLYEVEIRHLLRDGAYNLGGSFTPRKSNVATSNTTSKKIQRYHIEGDGSFKTSDYHYGFKLNKVSDRGYLTEYYQKHDPFLVSNLYGYKIDGENFIQVNNLALQGLGTNDSSYTDPYVVPELNFRYMVPFERLGDSSLQIDNYSSTYASAAFGRVTRSIWELSFAKSYTTDIGQIFDFEIYNRSDLYRVEKKLNNKKQNYTTGRSIPELHLTWRYPWGGLIKERMLVVEPIALVALGKRSPNYYDSAKFGLIDPKEYDFDDSSFFRFNRYSGFDYHEYGKRVTYGVNSLMNIMEGCRAGVFLGQFQRLSNGPSQKSDIVGRTSVNFADRLELYYRFRKSPDHFKSIFDELGVWYADSVVTVNGGWVKLNNVHLGNINKISQLYMDGGYMFNDNWSFGLGSRVDITSSHPRQLSRSMRVTYKGDCVSITTTVSNDYTVDSSRAIRKSKNLSISLGLKTLNM